MLWDQIYLLGHFKFRLEREKSEVGKPIKKSFLVQEESLGV